MSYSTETGNIAFVGCGSIAHVHMRFARRAGYDISAVCDASQIRADIFADKYGIPRRFTDIDTLLAEEKPRIIHILTPPHTHHALVMKSLAAGCNVFVEKPLCQSLAEYREMELLAAEKGLLVSVDHTRIYNPMIVQARNRVLDGEIGRVVRMEYAYDDPSLVLLAARDSSYRWARGVPAWFEKLKGGVLTDLLPHPLSVFLSFDSELQVKHVQARAIRGEIIGELTVLLQSAKLDAQLNLSLHQRPLKNMFCIYGEKGSIRIDLRNMFSVCQNERCLPGIVSRVVVALGESLQIAKTFSVNVLKLVTGCAHTYDGLETVMQKFYEAVSAGKNSDLPLINAAKVTAQVEQILEASLTGTASEARTALLPEAESRHDAADFLVIGGTGFIGRRIVDQLVAENKSTRAFCRSSRSSDCLPRSVGRAFGDLRDQGSIVAALAGVRTVIHCAAAMSGDWAEFHESTVFGTENLLKSLVGSSVNQLVYISSLGVLDYNRLSNGSRVDEDAPIEARPLDRGFYTRAKVEAEKLVMDFAAANPDIRVVIMRPGLVYGSDSNNNLQNCGLLLDRFLLVFGLGGRGLGLNYVENLAQAVVLAAETELASGTVMQIVDPEQPTVRDIISEHNKLSDRKVIPLYIPIFVWKTLFMLVDMLLYFKSGKAGTFRYRFASNAKTLHFRCDAARQLLAWLPRYDFTESFLRTYLKKS